MRMSSAAFAGRHGGLLRPGRRIDQKQLSTLLFSRTENVPKTRRLSGDNYGRIGFAAITPVACARLWVKVNYGSCAPVALTGDR